jgi:hypothetical protein
MTVDLLHVAKVTSEEVRAIIKTSRATTDPAIVLSIIQEESSFNPCALRYEPTWNYFYRVDVYAGLLKVTVETEKESQKFSWGLGQLMGSDARELGFCKPMPALCDPYMNVYYMCKKIDLIKEKVSPDGATTGSSSVERIFCCYNGGYGAVLKEVNGHFPNMEYVDSCLKHYKEFSS